MTDQLLRQRDSATVGESAAGTVGDRPEREMAARWEVRLDSEEVVSVLVRRSAINVLVNDESPSYTFDPRGRLHGAFVEGVNYRRSLDNRVLRKWSERAEGAPSRARRRGWLSSAETQALVEDVQRLVRRLAAHVGSAPPAVRAALADLLRWDWPALEADRQYFQSIYTPVGILPPDQYLALVLQATHGCSHNACTFCTFYRDVPFRIKSPDEFHGHITAVRDFFGSALAMRRSIFLADANALVIPMPRLLALLAEVSRITYHVSSVYCQGAGGDTPIMAGAPPPEHLTPDTPTPDTSTPDTPLPLYAFIDAFHVERKSVADWQELAARGLRRVYIGMETGHDPLLRWLNKPGDAADVLEAVTTLKAAGIQASVIIMLGGGGDRFAAGHVAGTVQLLNALPLGRGDLVYFSDFVEHPDAPYATLAASAGLRSLDAAARRAQETAIRASFVAHDSQHPPQFARYNIEEFIY
jgi:hypothetical protein